MLGMEQMYKMALDPRIYPDSRLLSIMQGKDQSLPMAIAMAAKQQRDKLQQAKTGAEAQQQAKHPTVKDQMLARDLPPEHSGLATLPAENMAGMDEEHMAAGGIVAFANRGVVPPPEDGSDQAEPPAQSAAAANVPDLGIGTPPKRLDRFAALGETQPAFDKKIAEEKSSGINDLAMMMGAKMAQTVGPLGKALGAGLEAGLPSVQASRKTIRELEKGRQDYQFNTAKAQAALDQGDQELALKYKELAEKSAYQMGLLAVEKTKAGAYAASVGTKEDLANQRRESSIMGIAKGLLEKNMKYNLPNTSPEERQAIEQAAINSAVNMYQSSQSAISGKGPVNISNIPVDAIDAAIARKQKQS